MDTWHFYTQILIPALNKGLLVSLKIIIPSACLGLAIGIMVGAGQAADPKWLRRFLNFYVSVFRGTPLVVQLILWFYGLPSLSLQLEAWLKPLNFPEFTWTMFMMTPFVAAVFGFTMCSGAYHSEYIRGALLSIRKGQFLAAESLGFTKSQTFWHITAPIAFRRALPGCSNEIIYLIKYSSLAILVTMREMTGEAKNIASLYFRHLECYLLVAIYYLILVSLATFLLHLLEKKLSLPGLGLQQNK
jgi:polar amino acid transport system permease protein